MRRFISCCFIYIVLMFLPDAGHASSKMKIIATIAPLADFAVQVGGDAVEVILLLPPGASPHTFSPTPGVVEKISRANIYLKVGAGLDFWADRIVRAIDKPMVVIECTEGLNLLAMGGGDLGAYSRDPHIWLDPIHAVFIVDKLGRTFASIDPENALRYERNAGDYIRKLRELDSEISDRLAQLSQREIITFHPSWNYFAKRYKLNIIGVLEEGTGREPSPRHLDDLLKSLRSLDRPVIFAEPQYDPRPAETLAREAGAKVHFLDPVGGTDGRRGYLDLMRYNLSVIEGALK